MVARLEWATQVTGGESTQMCVRTDDDNRLTHAFGLHRGHDSRKDSAVDHHVVNLAGKSGIHSQKSDGQEKTGDMRKVSIFLFQFSSYA